MNIQSAEKPVIGWFCSYTPEELLLAAGLESRRILGNCGNLSRADSYLHPNLCPYVRACFSSLLDGAHQDLAGIVGIDSCDAMRRLFDACRFFLSPKFSYTLSLPHECSQEAALRYLSELNRFAAALRQSFRNKLNEARLHSAIDIMNETRLILRQLDEARKSTALTDAQYYEAVLQAMTRPKMEFNQLWRLRLNELKGEKRLRHGQVNLVLSGGVLDDLWIIEAIEQAGGHVAADDLCCGSRYFDSLVETDSDPMLAIAQRYVLRVPCARMNAIETRIDHLTRLVEDSGARGVIYYSIKFCDPHLLDWAMLSQELQQRGIPALRCEADYSIGNREPMRTRIEAFLEMLR